jgi:hypothetical protein
MGSSASVDKPNDQSIEVYEDVVHERRSKRSSCSIFPTSEPKSTELLQPLPPHEQTPRRAKSALQKMDGLYQEDTKHLDFHEGESGGDQSDRLDQDQEVETFKQHLQAETSVRNQNENPSALPPPHRRQKSVKQHVCRWILEFLITFCPFTLVFIFLADGQSPPVEQDEWICYGQSECCELIC